jgi:hypothetical protein
VLYGTDIETQAASQILAAEIQQFSLHVTMMHA